MYLKTAHGLHICAYSGTITADRETVGEWETFQIERCDDQDDDNTCNGVGIVSWEGKYLSCNLSGELEWNQEEAGPWERVRIELTRRGFVIKSCCHGIYLCADEDGTVKCDREAAGRWESFEGGTFPVTLVSSRGPRRVRGRCSSATSKTVRPPSRPHHADDQRHGCH